MGGDGIRREVALNHVADLRTAAGLVLTAATAPSVAAAETNALTVQAAASSNVLGSFVFKVPKDYDRVADELTIRVFCNSGGTTDAPTLSCTAYNKRPGTALSATLTAVASAAIPKTTATTSEAEVTIGLSKNLVRHDDIITINLTSGAHTTDAILIYGVSVVYRGNIVFSASSAR